MVLSQASAVNEKVLHHFLLATKQWIGLRGIWIIKHYFASLCEVEKEFFLQKVDALTKVYSLVRAFRLILMDIKLCVVTALPAAFQLSIADLRYVDRQLVRMARLSFRVDDIPVSDIEI